MKDKLGFGDTTHMYTEKGYSHYNCWKKVKSASNDMFS